MSTKKGASSSGLGRDSNAQRLGIKVHDGMPAKNGYVIARQRGNSWYPGKNVKQGKDDTLYAVKDGTVKFTSSSKKTFKGTTKKIKVVNVI